MGSVVTRMDSVGEGLAISDSNKGTSEQPVCSKVAWSGSSWMAVCELVDFAEMRRARACIFDFLAFTGEVEVVFNSASCG